LEAIHPIVVADAVVKVALRFSVAAHLTGKLRNLIIVGGERSALAVCAEVLARIKTKSRTAP
jgi:hypothetical protein